MEQFENKVAIVTGGGSGIGKALCAELAHRGSVVIVADVNEDWARQVASAIAQKGLHASPARVDVSNEEDVCRLIRKTVSDYGRVDYMFNNAGIAIGGDARDLSTEQWRRVLDVNLYGAIYGTMAAYRVMVKQGHGHIINTASATGLLPQPGNAPYCTSKHGIVGLSLSLRCEGADLGVKVSAVCPGRVETNILQSAVIVNIPREQVIARFRLMSATKAAHVILRGVARNQALIVFPLSIRLAWRVYRLVPRAADPIGVRIMRNLRRIRIAPAPSGTPE
ncbi:MAG TPA: SDR family oxidoreductase [Candidatus Binataceae bacterium]|nr:SDR family oxidoreductase [Candidatus Binataceae bacterium]